MYSFSKQQSIAMYEPICTVCVGVKVLVLVGVVVGVGVFVPVGVGVGGKH